MEKLQRSFTHGELSPSLHARADSEMYISGLARCENYIVRPQGGAYTRPSTQFVGYLKNDNGNVRLIEFVFSSDEKYILVFENESMRVIRDGGFVLSPGTSDAYEIVTPYSGSELETLTYVQDADVMTICHPNHAPQYLRRLSETNWEIGPVGFMPGIQPPDLSHYDTPFKFSVTSITKSTSPVITVASAMPVSSGIVWVTLSIKSSFTGDTMYQLDDKSVQAEVLSSTTLRILNFNTTTFTDYVADSMELVRETITTTGDDFGTIEKTYNYQITTVSTLGEESLPSTTATIRTMALSETGGVRLMWLPVSNADFYRIYKEVTPGSSKFAWIGDSQDPMFIDYNYAPITSIAPPIDNQPFDTDGNYPAVVGYYQQRQIFAATYNRPQTVWATQTGYYDSLRYSTPSRDDDSIEFTVKATQINEIRHIVELDGLILLTSGGYFKVTEGQDDVLAPGKIGVRIQSGAASSKVRPLTVGSSIIYVQDNEFKVRDIRRGVNDIGYIGENLSLTAEHLFTNGIKELASMSEPFDLIWCITRNGKLLGLTYYPELNIYAWHKHDLNGAVSSIGCITDSFGQDNLYMVVKRNGRNVVEMMRSMEVAFSSDPNDHVRLDSSVTKIGSTITTVMGGLHHLEGMRITAVGDGNVYDNLLVTDGEITLPVPCARIKAGIAYECVIETLQLDINSPTDGMKNKLKNVNSITLEIQSSRGGWAQSLVDPNETGSQTEEVEIKPRGLTDDYGAIQLKTYKAGVTLPRGFNSSGAVRIIQKAPFPLNILSATLRYDVGGGM